MKSVLEPTPELYQAPINGISVPVRIWRGHTEGGVPIEAYVLSITPNNDADHEALQAELPPFMVPSREAYMIGVDIDTNPDTKEKTRLLTARGEVEAILRKHDICAHVVLLGRHRLDAMLHLDASWSNLSLVKDGQHHGIRLRSNLADDYDGDKHRQRQELEATSGMVHSLGEVLGRTGMAWLEASKQFDEVTGATHSPLQFEPEQ